MLPSTGAPPPWWPSSRQRYRADGQEFTPIEVPISTLAQVVADHVREPVDFLKVDVEGYEAEVLAGADWSRFRPRVVVIEATVPKSDEPAHQAWEPILVEAGYRFAMFDGLNRFYAHADEPALLSALAIPANVFDDFVPYAWAHQVDQAQQRAHRLEDAAHPGATRTRPPSRGCDPRPRSRPLPPRPGCHRRRRKYRPSAGRGSPGSHRTGRAEGHPHRKVHRVAARCLRHRTSRVQRSRTVRPGALEGEAQQMEPGSRSSARWPRTVKVYPLQWRSQQLPAFASSRRKPGDVVAKAGNRL